MYDREDREDYNKFIKKMMELGAMEDRACSELERNNAIKEAKELYNKHLAELDLLNIPVVSNKEKAKQLTQRFELIDREQRYQDELNLFEAKQCALVCVDEILKARTVGNTGVILDEDYWQEVKQEISLL